ncbi:hypothetical protein ACVL91_006651 [Bradyrhizobium elkanii]
MSRLAPLDPPYPADVQQHFDRIMRGKPPLMLFRVMAGHSARLGEVSRRQPIGPRAAVAKGAGDRDRPHLRTQRLRI